MLCSIFFRIFRRDIHIRNWLSVKMHEPNHTFPHKLPPLMNVVIPANWIQIKFHLHILAAQLHMCAHTAELFSAHYTMAALHCNLRINTCTTRYWMSNIFEMHLSLWVNALNWIAVIFFCIWFRKECWLLVVLIDCRIIGKLKLNNIHTSSYIHLLFHFFSWILKMTEEAI